MIRLTDQPIDTNVILTEVGDPHCGAVVLFVGTTRKWTRAIDKPPGVKVQFDDHQSGDHQTERQAAEGEPLKGQPAAGPLIETDHLLYDAYQEMAIKQMYELEKTVKARWPVQKVAMVHRLGRVDPTEPSVAVAVSCPHRSEAFEAARWLIDELKHQVPIWKQEHYAQRGPEWIHPSAGSCSCSSPARVDSAASADVRLPSGQTQTVDSRKFAQADAASVAGSDATQAPS